MASDDNYDMIFKLVLIGDSFVGKTNIMSKYLKNEFHEDSKATVGVEFGSKKFVVDKVNIKAQIWDTAGQERYKSITNAYYKGAKGAFVVYDISKKETFDNINKWIEELKNNGDSDVCILLIGNKCDLEDERQVTQDDALKKAEQFDIAFLETSALQAVNIEKAFNNMIEQISKKINIGNDDEKNNKIQENGITLNANEHLDKGNNNAKKKKKCCKK